MAMTAYSIVNPTCMLRNDWSMDTCTEELRSWLVTIASSELRLYTTMYRVF